MRKLNLHPVPGTVPNCINTAALKDQLRRAPRTTREGAPARILRKQVRRPLGRFTLTAYTLDFRCTGKRPSESGFGITASGTHARVGRTVAVDPRVIPIGSHVYIEGIGVRIAEDTGGSIRGKHVDILLPSEQAALTFGVKKHVYVYLEEMPR